MTPDPPGPDPTGPDPTGPDPTGAAVVAHDVVLGYRRRPVFGPTSFTIPRAGVTALIGPNGAGKSTILHAIAGAVVPLAGRLSVLGTEPRRVRRRVAYVFQSVHANERLPLTAREAVTIGRYASTGPLRPLRHPDRAAVAVAMERLDIVDLADRRIDELSGGQRQRVLVAQGLAQDAEVLLLDEPVTGLDLPSRERILAVVDEERAAGRTVVWSTHELSDAAAADHVLLLAGGVVAQGAPATVLTADHLAVAYAGRIVKVDGQTFLVDEARRTAHDRSSPHC